MSEGDKTTGKDKIKGKDQAAEEAQAAATDQAAGKEKAAGTDQAAGKEKAAETDPVAEKEKAATTDQAAEKEKAAETDQAAEKEKAAETDEAATKEGYILIVDDDPDMRSLIADILEVVPVPLKTAVDGKEALAQVKENLPTLMVLDVMMPIMSGFEVLEKLQQEEKTKGMPVVLLTAKGDIDEETLPENVHYVKKTGLRVAEFVALISGLLP